MALSMEKHNKRRMRSSYISVVISMSLVLFMLGLLGLLILNARMLSNYVKEDFAMSLILRPDASEISVRQFQKSLDIAPYVKQTEYISKEEAAEQLAAELNEDFVAYLGFNPLSNAIEVHFKADYTHPDSLAKVEKQLGDVSIIDEVIYDKPLLHLMNDNIQKISLAILGISALLTLIAFTLINGSIRLTIYSKRFLIKTMQLVGATKSFIRKPFLLRSLRLGLIGALLSILMLYGLLTIAEQQFPELADLKDYEAMAFLGGGLLLLGIFIAYLCTFFAVRKYLNLRTDQLYY